MRCCKFDRANRDNVSGFVHTQAMATNTISPGINEEDGVIDEASADETVPPVRYEITSFGADYDVEGLVRRLNRGEIITPDFQRKYVWKIKEASRFVESLLLGLPVPGVFLQREREGNKFLVIDGHQRLKTLLFFYGGYFNPSSDDDKEKVFKLLDVQKPFDGLTYKMLDQKDRLQLDNSIIHATIIKQDVPRDDDTSIFHIFERLNTGGMKLTPQEVRVATCHGPLIELLKELNADKNWRQIFGKTSIRLKDQELILRFLALYLERDKYEKPINEFLNVFAGRHRKPDGAFLKTCREKFTSAIAAAFQGLARIIHEGYA
jgi:uncharacterized protein with ParB-like and HNH nuclease domain